MRLLYNILLVLASIFSLVSCQEDMDLQGSNGTGYLLLTVSGSNETTTRTANLPGYTGRQIAVEVINDKDVVVEKTDDWENWKDESIELPVGKYMIKAYSYGFDGKQSAMAAPYYYGTKTVNIEKDKELRETVTCKLANVKMSVKITDEMREAFKSFTIYVTSKEAGKCDPIYFNIDLSTTAIKDTAYFPVTDLVVKYAATNLDNQKNEATKELTGVKGNDHYILNFTLGKAENGSGNVKVDVDESLNTYTYTFTVSQTPTNGATTTAGAWDKVAYLKAENVTAGSGVSLEGIKFQYREASIIQTKASEEENKNPWIDVETTVKDGVYTAFITGLNPATAYEYRLVNGESVEIQAPQSFTTEEASEEETTREILQNASFEEWCTVKAGLIGTVDTDYPNASSSDSYWDTSNKGANSLTAQNPTSKVTSPVVSGTYAAKLESKEVAGVFAAASLYTGAFGSVDFSSFGATLTFGQPFSSRPIALHGYYQYTPKNVNKIGDNLPANATVSNGSPDQCSIYIALAKKSYEINNKDEKTFIDFENDDNIIAYGSLESENVTLGENKVNGYTEFTIPVQYKEDQFSVVPSYIIVVCSASKYGDYMTGGVGSILYVDDFSLVYDGTPTIWE